MFLKQEKPEMYDLKKNPQNIFAYSFVYFLFYYNSPT